MLPTIPPPPPPPHKRVGGEGIQVGLHSEGTSVIWHIKPAVREF